MTINNDYKMYTKNLNGMSEFSGALIGDNLASFFSLDCVCLFLHSRFSISFLYNRNQKCICMIS